MAHLIRSAKSGNHWTTNDLTAYNITISPQSPDNFYPQPLPTVASLSNLDPHLISGTLDTQGSSNQTSRLLLHVDDASRANTGYESAIDDFVKELLHVLGYDEKHLLRSHYTVPLLINSDPNQTAQIDVCLCQLCQGLPTILLVVQRETTLSFRNPEPQVIAGAIAAFQYNNCIRAQLSKPELDSMTIPCIMMRGTQPTFYLVPVTRELSEAVATAQYPLSPTIVKKCVVVSKGRRLTEGMESPGFRQLALQHFTAFHNLAEAHWSALIPGAASLSNNIIRDTLVNCT